jgi:hypothetical protein
MECHLPGDPHPCARRLRALRDVPGHPDLHGDAQRLWPGERIDPAGDDQPPRGAPAVRNADRAERRAGDRAAVARAAGSILLPPADRRRHAPRAGAAIPDDAVHRAPLCSAVAGHGFPPPGQGEYYRVDCVSQRSARRCPIRSRRMDARARADRAVQRARRDDDVERRVSTFGGRERSRAMAG